MRRHDVKEIGLEISEVIPFVNSENEGFIIQWISDIGFGEYTIYKDVTNEDPQWYADSECMDCHKDKEFITELMRLFVEELVVKA